MEERGIKDQDEEILEQDGRADVLTHLAADTGLLLAWDMCRTDRSVASHSTT